MELSTNDQAKVRDYLLGRLTEEEQEKIEERLIVEDKLFEELEISKGELIEEYNADELPQKDREWFKDHYLASTEGRQRHAFVLTLDFIKRSQPAPQPLTWFERLKGLVRTRPWVVAIATGTALVLIAAVLIIPRSQTGSTSYAFNLNSTLTRRSSGDGRYYKVAADPNVYELRITLQLPEGATRGTDYRAELDDRSEKTSLKPVSHDANSVLVVIPTSSLHGGLYALRLYAVNGDGTEQLIPGEYLFELPKK
jgi:hypothetical protein